MKDYRLIPLHGKHGAGKFAKVSPEDYDELAQHRWLLTRSPSFNAAGYAVRYTHHVESGKRKSSVIIMHRVILCAPKGLVVDHINGDPLDNRRHNLRVCKHGQNIQNQVRKAKGTSVYKGVYRDASRWRAEIRAQGRKYNLGSFTCEAEAARAYDNAARGLHGEYANLNFP